MAAPERHRPANVVTSPERRRAFEAAGHWDGVTLSGRLAEHAAERADRVAVVDGGRVVELGPHRALATAGGAYAALYATWTAGATV